MGISPTGHAEIDHQHAILESMVEEVEELCAELARDPDPSCARCDNGKRRNCTAVLVTITSDIRAFLVGHATYEERLMELLPRTPKCRAHIKGHKAAHDAIAKQLKRIARRLGAECPRALANQMTAIIKGWIGDHTELFDHHLVSQLGGAAVTEIEFDGELVAILDEYVFHNRPTGSKRSPGAAPGLQRRKLEVRGRFESLSPAQRKVFWLVVNGSKNSEIAAQLGISINTVKTHRAAIFQKMEVSSVLDLLKKTEILRQVPRR